MPLDGRLLILTILATVVTLALIAAQVVWLVRTVLLRSRGHRVTFRNHNWRKISEEIAGLDSEADRERMERWSCILRRIYIAWVVTMVLFALLALSLYDG